jgi:biotin carboxyl carrier protein
MKLSARIGSEVHEVEVLRRDGMFVVNVDGMPHEADARKLQGDSFTILMEGRSYEVSVEPEGDRYYVRHGASACEVVLTDPGRRARDDRRAAGRGPENIAAVMPGRVVRVLVSEGDEVEAGQGLVVVEAMKMENEITSPRAGRVASVSVDAGRPVEAGATLIVIE